MIARPLGYVLLPGFRDSRLRGKYGKGYKGR